MIGARDWAFWFVIAWLTLGASALVLVLGFWRWIERWFPDWLGGTAIAFARAIAALAAIFKVGDSSGAWGRAQIGAIVSWFVWELTSLVGAYKINRRKKQLEGAESEGLFRTRLLAAIRFTVVDKQERIRKLLEAQSPTKPQIHRVREALDPEEQIYLTLKQMGAFLHESLPNTPEKSERTFRVGLYVSLNGSMQPAMSADLHKRRQAQFTSFERFPDRFRLDNHTDPSYVVQCIQQNRLLIVPDPALMTGFYFHDDQRRYLKSLMAYPIIPFGTDDVQGCAAIVIDTDVAGFFKEDGREALELFAREFAARLNLETFFLELLGGASS